VSFESSGKTAATTRGELLRRAAALTTAAMLGGGVALSPRANSASSLLGFGTCSRLDDVERPLVWQVGVVTSTGSRIVLIGPDLTPYTVVPTISALESVRDVKAGDVLWAFGSQLDEVTLAATDAYLNLDHFEGRLSVQQGNQVRVDLDPTPAEDTAHFDLAFDGRTAIVNTKTLPFAGEGVASTSEAARIVARGSGGTAPARVASLLNGKLVQVAGLFPVAIPRPGARPRVALLAGV
jgi:hypothetical protein